MPETAPKYAWYRDLTGYHWFVLAVASMGWMFDTMDQQLFNLARKPAMRELLGSGATNAMVDKQAAWATAVFMIGWATGGMFFGALGDRIGRAKTMMITILSYTVFTGLTVFSTGLWDFSLYRFLCGLGVGGQFGIGVALVAEVVTPRAFVVLKKLKEPDQWLKARAAKQKLGSYAELFSDPKLRRNSIVGFMLGF